jgi:hypothetical protein
MTLRVIQNFRFLIQNFISFAKNPNNPKYVNLSTYQRLLHVCFYYLPIKFIISIFILGLVEIAERMGFYNPIAMADNKEGIVLTVISVVILGPIVEECVFRLGLGHYRNKSYFKWLYYLSAFVFGAVHIFNYTFDHTHHILILFITGSQTFAGLMYGYIRIIYGFWYGVLLHVLFNSVVAIGEYTAIDLL